MGGGADFVIPIHPVSNRVLGLLSLIPPLIAQCSETRASPKDLLEGMILLVPSERFFANPDVGAEQGRSTRRVCEGDRSVPPMVMVFDQIRGFVHGRSEPVLFVQENE